MLGRTICLKCLNIFAPRAPKSFVIIIEFHILEIERHRGRIIVLTYEPKSTKESLFIVGKGVTYDTGGADIKAGGVMAGMSRDKCGAAAVAGFMKVRYAFIY